jgi:uncharacterized BrkB/YihY/UPF0761 family membrane protein
VLLTWFYAAGLVLLGGAVGNAVLADRLADGTDDRQVQHAGGRDDRR